MFKKGSTLLALALLCSLPACGPRKKKAEKPQNDKTAQRTEVFSQVNIPLAQAEDMQQADESIVSFFDPEAGEFVDMENERDPQHVADTKTGKGSDEFAWVDSDPESDLAFKNVYFDFDKHSIRPDQVAIAEHDAHAARLIEDSAATIVVEGHADHAAGSAAYNLALSQRRAKAVADHLVAQGVPRTAVKVVGRGKEMPAIIDGKPVTGSVAEQWPNRRAEVRVIKS